MGTSRILAFMEYLKEINKRFDSVCCHTRLTDDYEDIRRLAQFLKGFPNIQLIDILPYHTLGEYKWELGLEYPLKARPNLTRKP